MQNVTNRVIEPQILPLKFLPLGFRRRVEGRVSSVGGDEQRARFPGGYLGFDEPPPGRELRGVVGELH